MEKILVIDDETALRENIAEILTFQNYDVATAKNGLDAIEVLKNFEPDLILCDIMMPEMNGFEFIKHVRAVENLKNLPFIFLTAKADDDSIIKGFNAGAQDYVSKPFKLKELLARVKTHIELKLQREQLKKVNEYLEDKVKERTAELEKANKELELAHKQMLQLDLMKTEFLSIMSHEIRTPLNGIKVPIQLLKSKIENKSLVQLIDILDESATLLENFSIKALEITKLKSGTNQLDKSIVPIDHLVEFAMLDVQQMIMDKKITIDLKGDVDLAIIGDKNMLIKCIANILKNSCKYSHTNGLIEITTKKAGTTITIEIKDFGSVLNTNTFTDSFNLYTSGEKQIELNMGLGLFHSQLIVEAHKGRIKLNSNEKAGSTVTIEFPVW